MQYPFFFNPFGILSRFDNKIESLNIDNIVNVIERLSLDFNLSVYLYDYRSNKILYISPNHAFLCGYKSDDIQSGLFDFSKKVISPDDLAILKNINICSSNFFKRLSFKEKKNFMIEYSFSLKSVDNSRQMVTYKFIPLIFSESEEVIIALCTVHLTLTKNDHIAVIRKTNTNERLFFDLKSQRWIIMDNTKLTKQEYNVLQLSAQGYKNQQIAELSAININTVKFHKRNIFEKLQTKNIIESIVKARLLGII